MGEGGDFEILNNFDQVLEEQGKQFARQSGAWKHNGPHKSSVNKRTPGGMLGLQMQQNNL